MHGVSAPWSFRVNICMPYRICYFVCLYRSLSFLVKLEQLDLGSNELELLVCCAPCYLTVYIISRKTHRNLNST